MYANQDGLKFQVNVNPIVKQMKTGMVMLVFVIKDILNLMEPVNNALQDLKQMLIQLDANVLIKIKFSLLLLSHVPIAKLTLLQIIIGLLVYVAQDILLQMVLAFLLAKILLFSIQLLLNVNANQDTLLTEIHVKLIVHQAKNGTELLVFALTNKLFITRLVKSALQALFQILLELLVFALILDLFSKLAHSLATNALTILHLMPTSQVVFANQDLLRLQTVVANLNVLPTKLLT